MKRLSLRYQLGIIFLGFLLLVLSSVAITFWLVQTQQNDAALINLAGRQRMLAQQMARLALTDPDHPEQDAAVIRFAQTLDALSNGGEIQDSNGRFHTLNAPTDPAIRASLEAVDKRWQTFHQALQPPVNAAALPAVLDALLAELDTAVSAYEATAQTKIARLRGVQFAFLAAAFLLLAGGYGVVQRQLLRPLATLDTAAQEIGSGHQTTPLPDLPGQELARLGQTMEAMRREIAAHHHALEQQVARRTQELTAAFEFSQEIVRQMEPAQLLQSVTDRACELMQGQTSSICVLDGDGRFLELAANSGADSGYVGLRQSVARGLAVPVVGDRQTIVTAGGCANCGFLHHFPGAACIAAPLQVGGRSLGALCVARPQPLFDAAAARALTLLANAAAVALENGRLITAGKRQAEENASLAERERLAADLHDNLAQTLGALHLGADRLAGDLSAGEVAQAQDRLAQMQGNLKQAYAQVRMALTGLREPPPDDGELMAGVRAALAEFETQTGLSAELVGEVKPGWLTAVTQKQALHILREALTNIRRHAQATQVQIKMTQKEETFTLEIVDDGFGFDANWVNSQNHLGLTIMRARAERCQGRLTIHSIPGEGTRVTAVFPTTQTKELEPEAA